MGKSFTAGGVVVNADGYILVVNQNGDSWSLPKGHIDEGETALQTAAREIAEESGITELTFLGELGSYERYRIGLHGQGDDASQLKVITMFLYKTMQRVLQPTDPHNPEARWVSPGEVSRLLTHPKDKAFFESITPRLKDLVA